MPDETAVHTLQHAVIKFIDAQTTSNKRAAVREIRKVVEPAIEEYSLDKRITPSIFKSEFIELYDRDIDDLSGMERICHSIVDRLTDAVTEQEMGR